MVDLWLRINYIFTYGQVGLDLAFSKLNNHLKITLWFTLSLSNIKISLLNWIISAGRIEEIRKGANPFFTALEIRLQLNQGCCFLNCQTLCKATIQFVLQHKHEHVNKLISWNVDIFLLKDVLVLVESYNMSSGTWVNNSHFLLYNKYSWFEFCSQFHKAMFQSIMHTPSLSYSVSVIVKNSDCKCMFKHCKIITGNLCFNNSCRLF